ncbi:hypothetical protein [Kamptonema formosum]|uniref:hypothetical protein n=1 Tax=Kamptonema formosum TaxID=331992 RepID=UPI00034AE1DA|nr:hypothetical protein [Oscillatoria sp. PCC 10802]
MAGLYVTIGNTNTRRIFAAAQRLTFFPGEHASIIEEPGLGIAWVSHDPPELFAPAHHAQTGVRVVTAGRVAWDEPDWQRAEKMKEYTGGLSNRLLLDKYLSGGISAIERHNGSAALLIWDPRSQQLHLLTDHFGFYPVFLYRPQAIEGCAISSFPDAIADDPEVETTPDYVSMAEFLREWQATPPHTYYSEIKHAGAASHWCWDLAESTCRQRAYWQPFQEGFFPNLKTAAEQLSEAVKNAIKIRTLPRLGPAVSYTSGGMDSRAVLFSAADRSCVYGVNLYDVPNKEAALAKQLCETAGVRYIGFARDDDYYPRWMRSGVRLSGAMWSAEDNHFLGTRDLLQQLGARTVLTACPVDNLFKGDNLEKSYQQFLGRNLPFFQLESDRQDSFGYEHPQRPAPPKFGPEMERRIKEWFGDTPYHLKSNQDHLKFEDKQNRPGCYHAASSGPVMFRLFPYDSFIADRAIAECYSRIPARWKLNGTLWELTVARICGTNVVDANRGWRPGSSKAKKLLIFAKDWVLRRLKPVPVAQHQGPATDGSWPNLGWYVTHSTTLREMWESAPVADRQLMCDLWGSDPWSVPLAEWSKPAVLNSKGMSHGNSPYSLFRILTLLNYWSVRRDSTNKFVA